MKENSCRRCKVKQFSRGFFTGIKGEIRRFVKCQMHFFKSLGERGINRAGVWFMTFIKYLKIFEKKICWSCIQLKTWSFISQKYDPNWILYFGVPDDCIYPYNLTLNELLWWADLPTNCLSFQTNPKWPWRVRLPTSWRRARVRSRWPVRPTPTRPPGSSGGSTAELRRASTSRPSTIVR